MLGIQWYARDEHEAVDVAVVAANDGAVVARDIDANARDVDISPPPISTSSSSSSPTATISSPRVASYILGHSSLYTLK